MERFHARAHRKSDVLQNITANLTEKLMKTTSKIEATMPYRPTKVKRIVSKNCETTSVNVVLTAKLALGNAPFRNPKKTISNRCTRKKTAIDAISSLGEWDKIATNAGWVTSA